MPGATQPPGKSARRGKSGQPEPNPHTEAEVLRRMMDSGLITQPPDTDADFDDPDDQPITIEGEPLSETAGGPG